MKVMQLKTSVFNKLNKMSKEELLSLINEMCDCNNDVSTYINNTLSKTKIDMDKIITKIEKCFNGINFKTDKAMELYITTRKTTRDYNSLSEIGLCLLDCLIMDFGLGNFSDSRYKRIEKVADMVCEDIEKSNNSEHKKKYIEIIENDDIHEFLYEMLIETYYSYFSDMEEE